jgi:hypothetical protein
MIPASRSPRPQCPRCGPNPTSPKYPTKCRSQTRRSHHPDQRPSPQGTGFPDALSGHDHAAVAEGATDGARRSRRWHARRVATVPVFRGRPGCWSCGLRGWRYWRSVAPWQAGASWLISVPPHSTLCSPTTAAPAPACCASSTPSGFTKNWRAPRACRPRGPCPTAWIVTTVSSRPVSSSRLSRLRLV